MNHQINISRLKTIAEVLSDFESEIVFVGGATLSLYVTHPELTTIRVTDDVDVVIELVSNAPEIVKSYLKDQFQKLHTQPLFKEALIGHVEQQNPIPRAEKIIALLNDID